MSGQPSLVRAADRVSAALRRHAELCASDPGDAAAVMPALVDMREAMRAYSRLLSESTGWGPPFHAVEEGAPFESGDADEDADGGGAGERDGGAAGAAPDATGADGADEADEADEAGRAADTAGGADAGGADIPWVMVADKFILRVDRVEEFMAYARSRLGHDPASAAEATRLLCEADGWKPGGYPAGMFEVTEHTVDTCET